MWRSPGRWSCTGSPVSYKKKVKVMSERKDKKYAAAKARQQGRTKSKEQSDKELEARASGHGKKLTRGEIKALQSRGKYGETGGE